MKQYQFSDFENNSPISCSVQTITNTDPHMHDVFELDMVLSGNCTLKLDERLYKLEADDVFSVDPHVVHELKGADAVLVTIQFNQTLFENILPHPLHPHFDCNSRAYGNSEAYDALRKLIARIVKNNADKQLGYELRTHAMIYELMDLFFNNFRIENSSASDAKNHRYALRISEISKIISERYKESFSLTDLADEVHLSPPYLSRFFAQQFGMSFLSYLTRYRLGKAMNDLLNTQKNIEEISADNGFPNSHAFVQAFKNNYQELPSVYRRKARSSSKTAQDKPTLIEHHDHLAGLRKYLNTTSDATLNTQGISCYIKLRASEKGTPLKHKWKNILNIGNAADLMLSDIQEMVRIMQKEIGFRYIHFSGIFADELRVCQKDSSGKLIFNFVYLDVIFDFLMQQKIKPYIQLTYMPTLIAKHPYRRLFNAVVSDPADIGEWCELVKATVNHLIERYSKDEVQSWYFSIWNQPDTPPYLFGFGDDELFFEFYKSTFRVLKEIDSDLKIASSPTFYLLGREEENWYLPFIRRCVQEGLDHDALSFTFYDTRLVRGINKSRETFDFVETMQLSTDENSFSLFVNQILSERKALGLEQLPLYLTEWNNTPSQQDLLNDTCFKSCYLTKNILENYDKLDSFAYWSLTDLMGDAPLPDKMFFGGLGLFTKNGIAKPSFHAMKLLSQLNGNCIGKGNGWFAVKKDNTYKVLLYNYRHYTDLYASGEQFIVTYEDRYNIFEPTQTLDVHLRIEGAENGEYLVRETSVGRKNGSVYDLWIETGAIEPIDREEMELLKQKSIPMINNYRLTVTDQVIEVDAILDMLEVRLLTIW